jgi:PTH1 family peptidyl-tRNA hydrolase
MWLIVGLGNPGSQYEETPHNLGFMTARLLASRHRLSWKSSPQFKGEIADGQIGDTPIKLLMPTTYMNLSGESAGPLARYYKINPARVLPISDDVALPWGRLRLRDGGSHGGHNGLRNLIVHLGTDRFPRIRIGCAPEGWRGELRDYVLAKLRGEALDLANHMAEVAADAVETAVKVGTAKAQNRYNSYDALKSDEK